MRRSGLSRAASVAIVVVLGLFVSCSLATVQLTPTTGTSPTAVASATALPNPTTGPSSILTPTREPRLTAAATPRLVTQPPAGSPFERVDGFLRSTERLFAVVFGSPGYVAVGLENFPHGSEGRVWTSVDGWTWTRQETNMLNGYLETVIDFKGELYAFGHELDGVGGIGPGTVWRSPDAVTWEQATVLPDAMGHWMSVVTTDERLIAFSASGVSGERTWLSSDGADWRQPEGDSPNGNRSAATLGHTVVIAGGAYDNHVGLAPAVSIDDGDTWQRAPVESDYEFRTQFAVNNGVLLAATSACCGLPGVHVGVTLTSHDGLSWLVGEPLLPPASAVAAVPGGFLTLSDDGSTALSADGASWFSGPRMPALEGGVVERYFGGATAGPTGVLVGSSDYRNVMEFDARLWFAPINAFELSKWRVPVPLAEQPRVGATYQASIGSCPHSIRMGGQVWLPSSGISLEPYAVTDENATVTLVDDDQAVYTSDAGEAIPLEPVHPVPLDPDPGC